MPPDSFGTQLVDALTRNTPAFQTTPRPARQGFVRQLMDALARNTPAFQAGPAPAQPPGPGGGAAAQPRRRPARQHRTPSAAPSRRSSAAPQQGRTQTQTPTDQVSFLTVHQVASLMRVSKMTVYRLVNTGHLPAIRIGRSFRVPEQAVHDYLQESLRDVS